MFTKVPWYWLCLPHHVAISAEQRSATQRNAEKVKDRSNELKLILFRDEVKVLSYQMRCRSFFLVLLLPGSMGWSVNYLLESLKSQVQQAEKALQPVENLQEALAIGQNCIDSHQWTCAVFLNTRLHRIAERELRNEPNESMCLQHVVSAQNLGATLTRDDKLYYLSADACLLLKRAQRLYARCAALVDLLDPNDKQVQAEKLLHIDCDVIVSTLRNYDRACMADSTQPDRFDAPPPWAGEHVCWDDLDPSTVSK